MSAALLVLTAAAGTVVATAGESQAATLCHSRASGAPFKFGPVSDECSYTSPDSANWKGRLTIQWSAQAGTNQSACVEGRMGKARNPDKWQGLGCGASGQGTVSWPRNTASMLEIRVRSNSIHVAIVDYYI
ncbi:hypothetical protein [Amycolatopsis alkalitolerans]|uniref:Uncharacterized protein n=1 Tax=Amycolatopsis alkalitolerans TaxID=2547244 RepID=A0A5C4MBV7_9PSEU|nr:hypothetical protein [Amycolatopsis alkalitolerans]TNC29491.1 hypothetical protein FG385_00480 [Amycolatopsis alkalitolerans]